MITQKCNKIDRSRKIGRNDNIPKVLRTALSESKVLVKQKFIHIRKIDTGILILIIDLTEHKKLEEVSISKIAELPPKQSKWEKKLDICGCSNE